MDLTPANIRALRNEIHREFRGAFETTPVFYPQITTTVPSTSAKNDYTWMTSLPVMREWIGSRVVQNISQHAYSIENKLWEMTIGVKRDDIEDDNLGQYDTIAQSFGESARVHPDQLIQNLLENGETLRCFDGQYFFDTDHPLSSVGNQSGTYSNLFDNTPLTAENYEIVRSAMISIRGENGRSLGVRPNLLVVGPRNYVKARILVEIPTLANGAGNPYFGTARVLEIPEIEGEDWWLLATGRAIRPFILQTRRPLTFVTKNQITDEVVLIENEVRYYADARYNVGFSLPFLASKARA